MLSFVNNVPRVTLFGYQFQVRACATDGTCSAWSQTPKSLLATLDDSVTNIISAGNGQIAYSGSWLTKTLPGSFGGTVRSSTATGANATLQNVTFNVSGDAAWIAPTGPNMGIATVSVDGGASKTVDLYSATYQPAQVVFATNGLKAGVQHTLRVTVTANRNPASTGSEVDIDAFLAAH